MAFAVWRCLSLRARLKAGRVENIRYVEKRLTVVAMWRETVYEANCSVVRASFAK